MIEALFDALRLVFYTRMLYRKRVTKGKLDTRTQHKNEHSQGLLAILNDMATIFAEYPRMLNNSSNPDITPVSGDTSPS